MLTAEVTYLKHSGFCVATDSNALIFDYIGGQPAPKIGRAGTIIFISHSHGDHLSPAALDMRARGGCALVVGEDVDTPLADARMSPGDTLNISGARVRAFGSTDQGVSFLVQSGGISVFHAGDLNFWHWEDESTREEVAQAERAFEAVLDTIDPALPVDIAMFPVDPRLGARCGEGAIRFARRVRPRVIIPMHWWEDPEAARRFAESAALPPGTAARALTSPGATYTYSK